MLDITFFSRLYHAILQLVCTSTIIINDDEMQRVLQIHSDGYQNKQATSKIRAGGISKNA